MRFDIAPLPPLVQGFVVWQPNSGNKRKKTISSNRRTTYKFVRQNKSINRRKPRLSTKKTRINRKNYWNSA
ncbi:MAG TPA: hypothetical protein VGC76_12485 [Pyrinomonadaceae bacterium]|jgi:hypothetical protein